MAKYLFEYLDGNALRGFDYVDAASVQEARQRVAEVVGLRHLRQGTLLDDDLMAQLRASRVAPLHLAPDQLARIEAISRNGDAAWPLFVEALKINRWFIAACALTMAVGVARGWDLLAYVGVGGLVLLVGQFFFGRAKSRHYQRLLRAGALGQWAEVLKVARRMQEVASNSPQLAFDLDVRRGVALAATGHLGEAVALVAKWQAEDVQPKGMYWGRLASIYHSGRDYGQFLACMRRGFAESQLAIWARIDLALALARLGEDPREALELLRHESIEGQPEATARFIFWARGMALLRLGDSAGAEAALSKAVESFAAQVANPAVWGALALSTAALAVAVANNGHAEEARAVLSPLMPIVSVTADLPLMEMVRQRVQGGSS